MHIPSRKKWLLTIIYGFNHAGDSKCLWDELCFIGKDADSPWLVAGDFNNPLNLEDRVGANIFPYEYQPFRDCVEFNGLKDISAKGCFFTWNNKQQCGNRVFTKID